MRARISRRCADGLYDVHSSVGNGVEVQRRVPGEVRVRRREAKSSDLRAAPSAGVQQGSNGILGRSASGGSRINKQGREHRGRDSPKGSSKGRPMLVAGIDVGAEVHHVAGGADLPLATASAAPPSTLVVMEATGHYWQNLLAALTAKGFAVALVNPLRTHRFAGEELARTKTDRLDCWQIARFGAQKRPAPSYLPEAAVEELRELMRLRERLVEELVARLNQLHRLVDLGFPEFTRYLKDLNTELATALLHQYPTAQALRGISRKRLARLSYDGRHQVGTELAQQLIAAAAVSVGSQHSSSHQLGVRYACEDLETLRKRLKRLDGAVAGTLQQHQVGQLLTTIGGIGDTTAAMIIAELGDPARFQSAGALAAYVGVCPAHRHSGKHQPKRSSLTPIGNRRPDRK